MKTEDIKTLTDRHAAIKAECEKLGAEIERLKTGGGEWPEYGYEYFYITSNGNPQRDIWANAKADRSLQARGNIYRTVEAAKVADEQIQFLRRAMTAGDLAPDANGFIICTEKSPYQYQSTRLIGFRKFSTIEARDAFIESEGGIEIFRQKLAKGWPV